MDLIESVAWIGAGFGPTLLILQLVARGREKGIAIGSKLGKLKESKPELEVTL